MTKLGRVLAALFGVANVGGGVMSLVNSDMFLTQGIALTVILIQLLTGAFLLFLSLNSD